LRLPVRRSQIRAPVYYMRMRVLNADSVIATVFILAAAVGMLYLRETMQRRIVPDGPGALMAADADGLRELHVLYPRNGS
jgi:hypothetical protein